MNMKQMLAVLVVAFLGVSLAQAATTKALKVQAGDTAYICECGSKCGCEIASLKPGKCGCGHDLQKVAVTKATAKKAYYLADGKTRTFKLTGKYGCGCGGDCCGMISQKPAKCACGKEMVKAGK